MLQLIRVGDSYRLYNEDAVRGAEILGLALKEHIGIQEKGFTDSVEFPQNQLDSYLPKLVRAGERVAICDLSAQEKQEAEQEAHRGIHR